ncbi:LUD domain-containing protein [Candidatus Pacearchaeota archaeon]|nr:LUD domain-containing protein [Candidatus Pacearchaeota archaeon]
MEKSKWNKLADDKTIGRTIKALKENGMDAHIAINGKEAAKMVLEIIPKGSEVMTMSSITLEKTGISSEINDSGKFVSVRNKLYSMDRKEQGREMNRLGAAPDFAVGSVHALTEDGNIMIASASGSQLPAYAYASNKVIWVVGAQKIVKDLDEGMKRIYEYTFQLEDKRARAAYGMGSGVNKLLIVKKEIQKGRISIIIVKENLGF